MYSTHKQMDNVEGHLRFIAVYMARGKRVELASENYFARNALVFTLDQTYGTAYCKSRPNSFMWYD
jgi:hypothetical protein